MRCKIVSCYTEAVAGGLCAKHYMRLRRTGDANVTRQAGRKPGPKPGGVRHAQSTAEAEELRQKVATLRDENIALRWEGSALRGEVASLRRQLAAKPKQPAGPKPPPDPNTVEAKLRVQIRELKARLKRITDAPRGTLIISEAKLKKIRRAIHPDTEPDPVKKRWHEEASQIFNGLPMRVVKVD